MSQSNKQLQSMANRLKAGERFQQILMEFEPGDPRVIKFIEIARGKNGQQIAGIVCNMCKERGFTPQDLAQSYGVYM